MRANSFVFLIAILDVVSMRAILIHGFQITYQPIPSMNGGLLKKRVADVRQKHQYISMSPSAELIEPTVAPPTSVDTRGDEAITDAPTAGNSSEKYIVQKLRQELIDLGKRTERGFKASRSDRERAEKLILDLAQYNQVREPVRTYYGDKPTDHDVDTAALPPSIQGKWTLIYTDAPDITSLGVPSPFVTLGRIGQDCSNPPYISNVIEWCAPSWANNIPFLVGKNKVTSESARVLQKVVTFGSAVPASPTVVDLNVAGIQLSSGTTMSTSNERNDNIIRSDDLRAAIEEDGFIVGVLKQQQKDKPNIDLLKLDESRQPPFGSFEILYLDHTLRITKTSRNHYAINVRIQSPEDEWF